jgi:hypothetical protein
MAFSELFELVHAKRALYSRAWYRSFGQFNAVHFTFITRSPNLNGLLTEYDQSCSHQRLYRPLWQNAFLRHVRQSCSSRFQDLDSRGDTQQCDLVTRPLRLSIVNFRIYLTHFSMYLKLDSVSGATRSSRGCLHHAQLEIYQTLFVLILLYNILSTLRLITPSHTHLRSVRKKNM